MFLYKLYTYDTFVMFFTIKTIARRGQITTKFNVLISVADTGCLSRILDPEFFFVIPDPGGSWIQDPGTYIKKRGAK
jgi:hypothetical protein